MLLTQCQNTDYPGHVLESLACAIVAAAVQEERNPAIESTFSVSQIDELQAKEISTSLWGRLGVGWLRESTSTCVQVSGVVIDGYLGICEAS